LAPQKYKKIDEIQISTCFITDDAKTASNNLNLKDFGRIYLSAVIYNKHYAVDL
jgi:hypothetical protein